MSLLKKAEVFVSGCNGVKYNYEVGPVSELAPNWFVEGINCQLLIHLIYQNLFEIVLPKHLRSSELFANQELFIEKIIIGAEDDDILYSSLAEGDLIFMGPSYLKPKRDPDNEDAKLLHLAMVLEVSDDIVIIHARPGKGIVIEALFEAMLLQRRGKRPYQKIFGVKRLKV